MTFSPMPPVPDRVPGRSLSLGSLALPSRFCLAPLAGYTNLPFRLAVREMGGLGLATTDLVNARALLLGSAKTMDLVQSTEADRPWCVQIYGANPEELAEAARLVAALDASSIDINMGCPVNKVTRGGGGSALLCQVTKAVDLVRAVVDAVSVPVTVKMRLGWDSTTHTAPELAREFEQVGVKGITIHGRTREQGFSGSVDISGIRRVVEATRAIPVLGNGDVKTLADAAHMLRETGCAGLAIGRGAFLNPWFFRQLDAWDKTGDPGPPPSLMERLAFMKRHFQLLTSVRDERFACLTFRKVAGWYCKALKPGHDLQQELVMLNSISHFESLAERVQERISQRSGEAWEPVDHAVAVPDGPIAHW